MTDSSVLSLRCPVRGKSNEAPTCDIERVSGLNAAGIGTDAVLLRSSGFHLTNDTSMSSVVHGWHGQRKRGGESKQGTQSNAQEAIGAWAYLEGEGRAACISDGKGACDFDCEGPYEM